MYRFPETYHVDPESGTAFEDSLRVASHKEGQWNIAFVTRATAAKG